MAGTLVFFIIRYHLDLTPYMKGELSKVTSTPQTTVYDRQSNSEQNQGNPIENPKENEFSPSETLEGSYNKPSTPLPTGFVYLSEALPEAKFDVRYSTTHNFTGQVVDGYLSDNISMTAKAAEALQKASTFLNENGYGLLTYDSYRPKRAVSFFIEWGEQPETNLTKAEFYPSFAKKDLFELGYLARRSAHSRGSTIDLTLFDLKTSELLDMGSPYDFLGPISNHATKLITDTQTKNRNILKSAMKSAGFKELRTEWWHYQLLDEPFPETYFDFVIE